VFANIVILITGLAWPVLGGVFIWIFRDSLKLLTASLANRTVKVGGVEITAPPQPFVEAQQPERLEHGLEPSPPSSTTETGSTDIPQ